MQKKKKRTVYGLPLKDCDYIYLRGPVDQESSSFLLLIVKPMDWGGTLPGCWLECRSKPNVLKSVFYKHS